MATSVASVWGLFRDSYQELPAQCRGRAGLNQFEIKVRSSTVYDLAACFCSVAIKGNIMKKVAIASVALMALSTPAMAQVQFFDEDSSAGAVITYNLQGTVDEICGLTAVSNDVDIDFGELATTASNVDRSSEFGMVCNSAAGATLTASSANGGVLLRDGTITGAGNEIGYKANIGTGSRDIGVNTPPITLTTAGKDYVIPGSAALRSGVPVGVQFRVQGVQGTPFQGAPTTTVFAGDYSDTVTVSLTAS